MAIADVANAGQEHSLELLGGRARGLRVPVHTGRPFGLWKRTIRPCERVELRKGGEASSGFVAALSGRDKPSRKPR